MDNNYNVDDILSEIKRKKSGGKPAPQASDEAIPVPARTAEEGGMEEKLKDFKLNINFDGDAPAEPAAEYSHGDSGSFFLGTPETEQKATGSNLRFAPPKAGQKPSGDNLRFAPPGASQKSSGGNFKFATRESEQTKPERGFAFGPGEHGADAKSNPLDFSGHVRPITDRARIRQGYNRFAAGASRQKPAESGEFNFSADALQQAPETGSEAESTRVLPRFITGRELKLEDIQGLDFGPDNLSPPVYEEDDDDYSGSTHPDGAKIDFSEYNSTKNRDDVATDIAHTKLWLFVRASLTAVLTFVSIYFMLSGKYPDLPMFPAVWPEGETMRMFMSVSTILAVLVAVVNSSAMGGGLIGFFKMRANADSLTAFAVLAVIAQGIFGITAPDKVAPETMSFYACIACIAMLFNSLGKMSMINRIQRNFRILGAEREKWAVLPVDSPEFCREFMPEATRRKPTIVYGVKSGFFTDFLALSYSDKYDVGINRTVAPVCVAGALVVGISTYFLTDDYAGAANQAVSAIAAILCVCATLSSTFIENIPLSKIAKKLTPCGGMVSGSKAVEDFCDTGAVILTEKDLFGKDSVALQGIKAFSQNMIDQAILDAASVLCALDGALAPLFLQMINNNKKLLKKVDNIVFENDMGVSAWIDSRRVLIGNRMLMLNHGITIPTDSYERGDTDGAVGEPLYISNSGEVCARFLVGYHIDEELAVELDHLAAKGKRLIVYTTDANISSRKIWEAYGYPEDLVTIIPTARHRDFRLMSAPREDAVAAIVYTGRSVAMVRSVLACINARSSILVATIAGLAQMILGYGLVAFLAFMGAIGTLSAPQLLAYQAFWFAAIFIMQQLRN